MMENRPRAIGFNSGFSQDSISITVGEQITVEQLIEKCKVMTISKEMIMHIGITSMSSRPTLACIYYYYSTHRLLSSMHLEY